MPPLQYGLKKCVFKRVDQTLRGGRLAELSIRICNEVRFLRSGPLIGE